MEAIRFSIIIPTRNRSYTLKETIQTCLNQNYTNYEIIVSDNHSVDDTSTVVQGFSSTHIKYLKPPHSCSMTENWEFALSQATGDYIAILGDDDGMMPNALNNALALIQTWKMEAIIGRKDLYKWPNIAEVDQRNFLRCEVRVATKILKSKDVLKNALYGTGYYHNLPMIYSVGFISKNVIENVKQKNNGVYFNSPIPDLYSGVVNSCIIDTYLFANVSFFLSGISAASNGASMAIQNSDKSIITSFIKENKIPFHEKLIFCQSNNIIIAESYLKVYEMGLLQEPLDFEKLVVSTLESLNIVKSKFIYEAVIDGLRKIAEINRLPKETSDLIHNHKLAPSIIRFWINIYRMVRDNLYENVYVLDNKNEGIAKACLYNNTLNKKKDSILQNSVFIISLKWVYLKYIK